MAAVDIYNGGLDKLLAAYYQLHTAQNGRLESKGTERLMIKGQFCFMELDVFGSLIRTCIGPPKRKSCNSCDRTVGPVLKASRYLTREDLTLELPRWSGLLEQVAQERLKPWQIHRVVTLCTLPFFFFAYGEK